VNPPGRRKSPPRRVEGEASERPRRAPARPVVVLSIPSQTTFLGLVLDVTRKLATAAGFEEGTSERLALAVDEATTNAIKHAYHGDPDQRVDVRFDDRGLDFRVEVVDTGTMVDPRRMPRADLEHLERSVSERRKGGLGVHLMEKIMDSVTFQRSARRNVCRLVKRKDTPAGGR
jgi:serine/threonine-protein kinase RsbW